MARTALTKYLLPGPYAVAGVVVTEQAATGGSGAAGNSIVLTGSELVIAHNTDAASHTVTVTSIGDPQGRLGDAGPITLAAGEYRAFQRFPLAGWLQTDGNLYLEASSALVKFLVVQLP